MEDVNYLAQHSREESFLFVVDSAMRDRYAYPSSAEYAIEFNAPFRNVFAVDMLNATVPRTEYAVEEGHNVLVYTVAGEERTLRIEPGDYNLVQLCDAMNAGLEHVFIEPHSSPYQLRSRARFYSPLPFSINAAESTATPELGFHGTDPVYHSALTGTSSGRAFWGPFPGFETVTLGAAVLIRQPFTATASGMVSEIMVHDATVNARIVDDGGTVYAASTSGELVAHVPLVTGGAYAIEFSSSSPATLYVNAPRNDEAAAQIGETPLDATVCAEVFVAVPRYEIESPGIVDLTGERHVLVRCPEVESLVHRDRAFERFHAGLGMVTMGANGYQDQRTEFISFPGRKMHVPIGKLSKLSFRLEKPDGTLYNTRGLDHTLVLAIRYYTIIAPASHASTLNPHYTPDLHAYLNAKWKAEIEARDAA